jgi:threonine dehydrogenase-like Zn-dependent dehydrogenase
MSVWLPGSLAPTGSSRCPATPNGRKLARFYGATDIVEVRGDEGLAKVKELTNGLGAQSVIEAVGTQESTMQAINATRPGGHMGFVGVNYEVTIPGPTCFSPASTSTVVPPPCGGSCRT